MFEYARQNGIIKENPTAFIKIKLPKTKKKVINATETFRKLWTAINDLYRDDPYHLALFKFLILQGRRKGEVFGLRWENIDFDHMTYTIEATKSGEDQTYTLPKTIAEDLQKLPRSRSGYVFESPITGGKLKDIRGQVSKIRERSGIETFTPHFARNVLVSMLAEGGVDAVFLSSVLGHTDATTINKYLSLPREKASRVAEDVIDAVIE
jgi:integrase